MYKFLILFVLVLPQAKALVSIANGNYYVGAIDIVNSTGNNGIDVKVQRNYNSRTQYEGIFGYGWGTDYEAYLIPQADGSVVVQESGGGDKTRFSPADFSRENLEKYVQSLVVERSKQKGFANSQGYKERLMKDANFRDEETRALGIFPKFPVGTKLYTTQRGEKQFVVATAEGYVREYGDGRQEFFTQKADVTDFGVDPSKRRVLKGVLKPTRMFDPIKNANVYYVYNNKGQLATITDKKTINMRLNYNSAGKVVEVVDSKGKRSTYKYCEANGSYNGNAKCGPNDLIEVHTTDPGIVFKYQYDNVHNIVMVDFGGGKKDITAFYSPDQGGGIKSLIKDNVQNEYTYWRDPSSPTEHYKTKVKTTYLDTKHSSDSEFEYYDKARADGSRYRYKMVTMQDGESTETIYNECCGQPIKIKGPGGDTSFEYYAGTGLPKEKNTSSEVIQWEYHPKLKGKITKLTVMQKASKGVQSSVFTYDDKTGQLKMAKTSDGRGVALAYDEQGRIKAMIDQDKRKLLFKYNNDSKPAEIVQDGIGSIQVAYDKDGQIRDVKSKGGRQISMSVAAAFQNLLEIIKPAGVQPL